MVSVLRLFRANNDTAEIAKILRITEAEAYNRLAEEREAARETRMRNERRRREEAAMNEYALEA